MIIDNLIIEYDIRMAGPTLLLDKGVLSEEDYNHLISLPKNERYVATGKLQINNPEYYDVIKDGYKKYTKLFIESNNIKEDDILEINNDAVWLIGKVPNKLKFGKIEFVKKSEYTLVFVVKPRVKIYFNENVNLSHYDRIRVRGATLNVASSLYKEIDKLFLLYSQKKTEILYNELHRLLKHYTKNKDPENNLLNNIENLLILKKLIKYML